MERSSIIVLEDAKIDRKTPGVTGIRRFALVDVSLPTEEVGGDRFPYFLYGVSFDFTTVLSLADMTVEMVVSLEIEAAFELA
jgi:hypothetical protein